VRRYLSLAILLVVGVLAGVAVRACASDDEPADALPAAAAPPASFADCRALTSPPPESPTSGGTPTGATLPDADLPCLGGGSLRLTDVRGPAVINLWGSWCPPCRDELPAFRAVASQTAGLVHFLGVDTKDGRTEGEDLVTEFGLPYPNVFDRDERVRIALEQPGIPITVLVNSAGQVIYLHNSARLDEASLTGLIEQHLGVAVPVG